MSIFEQELKPNMDEIAASVALGLKISAQQTLNFISDVFNNTTKTFWDHPAGVTPEAIAAKLGTDAKEVFELHYKLGAFIIDINKIEKIYDGLSLVGEFTYNEDGSVNISTKADADNSVPSNNNSV